MKTLLGTILPLSARGVLYLCEYNRETLTLKVVREIIYGNSFHALNDFANIRNPESQVALGSSYEELCLELEKLQTNMLNPDWQKNLINYL